MRRIVEKYDFEVLNGIRTILKSVGMPENLYNPRCVMVMAACLEMTPNTKWSSISEDYHGTHDIIQFINNNYPNKAGLDTKGYQENSRETIRDNTLKVFVTAALMEEKQGLASNDRNNAYRITSKFASLVRHFNTNRWDEELKAFLRNYTTYSEMIKQVRDIETGYSINYNNVNFNLDRSNHNNLQKQILEIFAPIFAPGSFLLYIGDASNRLLYCDYNKMAELGINVITDSSKLPDIILYDEKNHRILFIEAYSSTGEFNFDRVNYIKSLCTCDSNIEVAFITAFLTTKKMLQVYPKIAWDTDIWVAEDSTHMTHKNGDKFIGRPLR